MVGFFASGAWMASRRVQGEYGRGLVLRPLVMFRPDFLLSGGIVLVKGTLLVGMGLMLSLHDHLSLPKWSFAGFDLAFLGILTLIPIRGMFKMLAGRRRRLLGDPGGLGWKVTLARGPILFVGLSLLMYGSLNAFKGYVPLSGELPIRTSNPNGLPQALILLLGSFLILVVVRESYKRTLPEGAETWGQALVKQLLLFVGVVALVLSYLSLFALPPNAFDGGDGLTLHPHENPIGTALSLAFVVLGFVLMVPLRALALRNEFRATIRAMVGLLADMPDTMRRSTLASRLGVPPSMPEPQRLAHVEPMLEGLQAPSEEKRGEVLGTQMKVMASLPPSWRSSILETMTQAMAQANADPQRRRR